LIDSIGPIRPIDSIRPINPIDSIGPISLIGGKGRESIEPIGHIQVRGESNKHGVKIDPAEKYSVIKWLNFKF